MVFKSSKQRKAVMAKLKQRATVVISVGKAEAGGYRTFVEKQGKPNTQGSMKINILSSKHFVNKEDAIKEFKRLKRNPR